MVPVLLGLAVVFVTLVAWLGDDVLGAWTQWLTTSAVGLVCAAAAVCVDTYRRQRRSKAGEGT